jgi:hypothetical protein
MDIVEFVYRLVRLVLYQPALEILTELERGKSRIQEDRLYFDGKALLHEIAWYQKDSTVLYVAQLTDKNLPFVEDRIEELPRRREVKVTIEGKYLGYFKVQHYRDFKWGGLDNRLYVLDNIAA